MIDQKQIADLGERIAREFQPERIILFGSYAYGKPGPDSDVDLLVVMPVEGSRHEKVVEIRVAINGMGLAKDVFIVTPEEIEKYRNVVGTIIKTAVHEGKVLYDRAA